MASRLFRAFLLFLLLLPVLRLQAQNNVPGYHSQHELVPEVPQTGNRPSILGRSAIAIDVRTGKILYEKNSTLRQPAASTQKLLTALVIIRDGDLDKRITVREIDTQCEPSKVYLRPGETYTRWQILQALLVHSGNDCARALARDNAGSIPAFATKMNRLARELGAMNSHFVNPNGLPADDQYSCARDIAIIARTAYRSPAIRRIVCLKTLDFQHPDGKIVTFKNTNKLLVNAPFCNGMKTGYTDQAGHCLVSSGSSENREAICVIMHDSKPGIWADSYRLLSWALGI